MKKHMRTFKRDEVVVVPFPFTDHNAAKRRPALVLSDSLSLGTDKSILAMITSSSHQSWLLDFEIEDLEAAGLKSPSIVRMKLFTLDNSLIIKTIGKLSYKDAKVLTRNLIRVFSLNLQNYDD
jgi:mRNA interferase MazF